MREILRLFSDRDSRDELGLGQIRDALSDALFPGTSTLLTRARYLLFVPWCLQLAAHHPDPVREADRAEHQLIAAIRDTSDTAGLLGMRVGAALSNLPSGVYWTMLRHYRILRDPGLSRSEAVRLPRRAREADDLGGVGGVHVWAQMPPVPEGFPRSVPDGFDLSADEAAWMRERLLDGAPDTLLAHLLFDAPQRDSTAPWRDAAARSVDGRPRTLLEHAQAFSVVMHGAQLLYNLLLAEDYEGAGFERVTVPSPATATLSTAGRACSRPTSISLAGISVCFSARSSFNAARPCTPRRERSSSAGPSSSAVATRPRSPTMTRCAASSCVGSGNTRVPRLGSAIAHAWRTGPAPRAREP